VTAGCSTPEEAARGDIPERYARVIASALSHEGRHAVVLMETNEPPAVEIYICERQEDGSCHSLSGSNGGGEFWFEDGVHVTSSRIERPDGPVDFDVKWSRWR
jgi:hypothetical protein